MIPTIEIYNQSMFDFKDKKLKRKISLIFADLPYGITHLSYDKVGFDLVEYWEFCKYYLKKDGVVVMTATLDFAIKILETAPKKWFRYDLIWEKSHATGHLNSKKRPLRAHELVLVFSPKGKHCYNPQMTHGHPRKVSSAESRNKCKNGDVYGKQNVRTDYDSTDRYPRSVIKFAHDIQKNYLHPNQKPVGLLEWIIKTYSNEGDIVLDPVAGSGTTGIAAFNNNRYSVLIENDENYFNILKDRVERETGVYHERRN